MNLIKVKRRNVDSYGTFNFDGNPDNYVNNKIVDTKGLIKTIKFNHNILKCRTYFCYPNLENIIFNEGLLHIHNFISTKYNISPKFLKSIDFPESLRTISSEAFSNCENLETITFKSLLDVSTSSFRNCKKLRNINFNIENKKLKIIIDKKYELEEIRSNSKYMTIECFNNDQTEKLIILVDEYLNKKEEIILYEINDNFVLNNKIVIKDVYDKINSCCRLKNIFSIKLIDFSNIMNKDIFFDVEYEKLRINKIILPSLDKIKDVNIQLNYNSKVNNIIIGNNNINCLDSNMYNLNVDNNYYIYNIRKIQNYYVFNMYKDEFKKDEIKSILLNNKNQIVTTYNYEVNSVKHISDINDNNNNNKLDNILKKHNISKNALKEILEVIIDSLDESEINTNSDELKKVKQYVK